MLNHHYNQYWEANWLILYLIWFETRILQVHHSLLLVFNHRPKLNSSNFIKIPYLLVFHSQFPVVRSVKSTHVSRQYNEWFILKITQEYGFASSLKFYDWRSVDWFCINSFQLWNKSQQLIKLMQIVYKCKERCVLYLKSPRAMQWWCNLSESKPQKAQFQWSKIYLFKGRKLEAKCS